jgi:hypothetical protein
MNGLGQIARTFALTGPPPINNDITNDAIGGSASNALFVGEHPSVSSSYGRDGSKHLPIFCVNTLNSATNPP